MMRWFLLLSLVACVDGGTPSEFLIYDVDPALGEYRMMRARIDTLEDPHRGIGTVAEVRGGGSMVIKNADPQTEAEWQEAFVLDGDAAPDIQWALRDNGVAMPLDFDSAMMLTLYHHLERASEYFDGIGVPLTAVRRLPVYYATNLEVTIFFLPVPLLSDNAAYVMNVDAFLIPPRNILDDVPLFANRGVMIHEYSHAVFNRLVHGDTRAPAYLLEDWPPAVMNEMRSLDEGAADFFAASAVDNSDFLSASIPEEFDIDRDLAAERHYDDEVRWSVTNDDILSYDPYQLGSVIASTLWALRADVDHATLAKAVVAALDSTAPVDTFTVVAFFDSVVDELPVAIRTDACLLFAERLDVVAVELTCLF